MSFKMQQIKSLHLGTIFTGSLILAGCMSTPFQHTPSNHQANPTPLVAAPTDSVNNNALPPLEDPNTQFPENSIIQPGINSTTNQNAALDNPAQSGSITSDDNKIDTYSMTGHWQMTSGIDHCRLNFSLTKWQSGQRASALGCSNNELKSISSWISTGQTITLNNRDGAQIATLYSVGSKRFAGQTASGKAITVYR